MSSVVPRIAPRRSGYLQRGVPEMTFEHEQLEGLVDSVLSQVRGITREDAEDAVQDAWIVLTRKADQLEPGPIGGYLLRTARFNALKIRDKRRRTTSLDGLTEAAGDAVEALIDTHSSFEAELTLAEVATDPFAAEALAAASEGAAAQVAPRGMNHRCSRYTDEQIARVRALRADGLIYSRIETLTGVPAGYCSLIVRRGARVTKTTEGWTRSRALDAIRRFHSRTDRVPRLRDLTEDLATPSPNTLKRLFGSFQEALRTAGLTPAYDGRRVAPWTNEQVVMAFCAWRLREKRWPNQQEMAADPDLPSPATTRRRLGTQSPNRLGAMIRAQLA